VSGIVERKIERRTEKEKAQNYFSKRKYLFFF
jgi:hypothetical protein